MAQNKKNSNKQTQKKEGTSAPKSDAKTTVQTSNSKSAPKRAEGKRSPKSGDARSEGSSKGKPSVPDRKKTPKGTLKKDVNLGQNASVKKSQLKPGSEQPFLSQDAVRELLQKEIGIRKVSSSDLNEDVWTATTCLNLWCCLGQDLYGAGHSIARRVQLLGIRKAIGEADKAHSCLTHEEYENIPAFWSAVFTRTRGNQLDIGDALEVTNFPKRLRLVTVDHSEEVRGWIVQNRQLSHYGHMLRFLHDYDLQGSDQDWVSGIAEPSEYILEKVAYWLSVVFADYKRDESLFTLPPGSTYEGFSLYCEKIQRIWEQQTWLRDHGVNIPWFPMEQERIVPDVKRLIVVPKNYKKGRFVCPEPVARQVFGYTIASGLYRCLRKFGIDTHDQELNRKAIVGSGELPATIDLTGASDSIATAMVVSLCRYLPDLYQDMYECRSKWVQIGNQVLWDSHWFTMGNAVTFNFQTGIYLSIALTALEIYCSKHASKRVWKRTFEKLRKEIHVYGDDIEVPEVIYDLTVEILTNLGFLVNEEKTFHGNYAYRESCGCESWHGQELNLVRWPRGTSRVPIAELVSMQHKLHTRPRCNDYLTSVILDAFPKIKLGVPGSPYMDLWDDAAIDLADGDRHSPYAVHRTTVSARWLVLDEKNKALVRMALTRSKVWKGSNAPKSFDLDSYLWSLTKDGLVSIQTPEDPKMLKTAVIDALSRKEKAPCVLYSYLPVKSGTGYVRDVVPEDRGVEYEKHTVLSSRSTGVIPADPRGFYEFAIYYLTLGGNPEHVNTSPFTKDEDRIADRRDYFGKRIVFLDNKEVLW